MRRTVALVALVAFAQGCTVEGSRAAPEPAAAHDPVLAAQPGEGDAPHVASPRDAGGGTDAAMGDAPATGEDPVARELAALRARPLHDPPAIADIQALVRGGIPKPPDARIAATHAKLMEWGQDAITLAFLVATTSDASAARGHATKLRATLNRWVSYGASFGDPKDTPNYGNASLELTWFTGNVARAAKILNDQAARLDGGAAASWTPAEHAALGAWARAVQATYIDFAVFPAGLSNRKASQLETMMRIAELDGAKGDARVAALFASLTALLGSAVRDRGDIPEDSARDKYHPQFFLASALQALEIGARHGLVLPAAGRDGTADGGTTGNATAHLVAAIRYAADTNGNDLPPAEYPKIDNPAANHEIPFWILARDFMDDRGLARTASVDAMVTRGYAKPSSFGFVMDWGFNAIARAKGL